LNRIRLLPLVLIAVTALLAVKVLEFATGVGSFAVGPSEAIASGEGGHGGGEGEAAAPAAPVDNTQQLMAPVDLSAEYLKQQEEAAAAAKKAEGHGEGGGHGEAAAPAEHGTPAPADHSAPAAAEAAPAAHGEAAPAAEAAHGAAAPAAAHGDAAAPAAAHGEAAPAAGHGEAAPAAAHGEAAGGHGGKPAGTGAYTARPPEYQPPIDSSESAILESLATRRQELDKREQDIDLRMKLLQAAEQRLGQRYEELKAIETQLGGADQKQNQQKESEQVTGLVALYEGMKPKAAAVVFDQLDLQVLLQIATRMNPRKLSPILAVMSPDKAGILTTAMAGPQSARKIVVTTEVAPPPPVPPAAADPANLPQIQAAPSP
jgi:flagellar motility protein MotE (MotC chaperone)